LNDASANAPAAQNLAEVALQTHALAHDVVQLHEVVVGVLVVAKTTGLGIEGDALA